MGDGLPVVPSELDGHVQIPRRAAVAPSEPATVEALVQLAFARLSESPPPTGPRTLAILRALASGAGAVYARDVMTIVQSAIEGLTYEPGAPLTAALADLAGPDVPPD